MKYKFEWSDLILLVCGIVLLGFAYLSWLYINALVPSR